MDIADIAKEFSAAKLLGVGESSHGTREFFEFKSKLFQELVLKHSFNTLLFEDSPKASKAINKFIVGGESKPHELMRELYPVWQVEELKHLVLWLRENYKSHKVEFVGFDIDQGKESIQKRDELMARNIKKHLDSKPNTKALVWAHNSHLQVAGSDFNQKPMGLFLRKYFDNEYIAIALLFGKGAVSATRLKVDSPSNNYRTLGTITVNSIPSQLSEFTLDGISDKPFFLTKKQMKEIETNSLKVVRSIGWGLVPELGNEIVEKTDVKKSFDGLVYYPISNHSHPLQQ